jgi:phospholipid/cholesterol/gamma-HCH transport system permease protein
VSQSTTHPPPSIRVERHAQSPRQLRVVIEGDWRLEDAVPDLRLFRVALESPPLPESVIFDSSRLGSWGSSLVSLLLRIRDLCAAKSVRMDTGALPSGLRRLMDLAVAVPIRRDARRQESEVHPVERVGIEVHRWRTSVRDTIGFLGECTLSVLHWLRGRSHFRRADLGLLLQQCGVDALPIVSLISFLVGWILAFVGAVQLANFGATIYVADLVAVAMTREMGCIMVGIVLCGRTGAAFAAQLGTMKVNQEIDALRMFGISPVDFLVLPRLLALFLMIPLLTLYADVVGIAGGFVVAKLMLGLSLREYWEETREALTLLNVGSGVVKSAVFGLIISFTGCLRGLQCGTNSAAVGLATTSAVVTAITGVIAADAAFAILFNVLQI